METQSDRFTDDMRAILARARREAGTRHAALLDVEHLMMGLLKQHSGTAYEALKSFGADTNVLYERVAAEVGIERSEPFEVKGATRAAQEALNRALRLAAALHHEALDSGHLLLSLMQETEGIVHDALADTPLKVDDVRGYLRYTAPAPSAAAGPTRSGIPPRRRTPILEQTEFVLIPTRKNRRPSTTDVNRWGKWPWIIGGIGLLIAYLVFVLPGNSLFTFALVFIGWIFSVTFHEFGHALVAYMGGDHTVKEKGYLSFNPMKYTHPMLSIALPLLFLAMGGIGLPGGAVYIERHRLRNKWWGAAVSAAGPTANLLLAGLLSLPFVLGLVDTRMIEWKIWFGRSDMGTGFWEDATVWSAVAMLAMLQITAVLFNLLPIPPLDGFGILEPFLDERTRWQLRQFGTWGIFLVFIAMWYIPPVAEGFWKMVLQTTDFLQIPNELVREGFRNFLFWRNPPS
jgi:Zn-dependent protease